MNTLLPARSFPMHSEVDANLLAYVKGAIPRHEDTPVLGQWHSLDWLCDHFSELDVAVDEQAEVAALPVIGDDERLIGCLLLPDDLIEIEVVLGHAGQACAEKQENE